MESEVEGAFDVVIFIYVETDTRLKRLREREVRCHGVADSNLLEWTAKYDQGTHLRILFVVLAANLVVAGRGNTRRQSSFSWKLGAVYL